MDNRKRFPPEVREWAVRLVFDQANEYSSQWACIAALAPKFGCTAQTLSDWVKKSEIDNGGRPGLSNAQMILGFLSDPEENYRLTTAASIPL